VGPVLRWVVRDHWGAVMTAKPTPLPWMVIDGNLLGGGETLGVIYRTEAWTHGDPVEHEDQANAEFIERACNSHGTLMNALKVVEATLPHMTGNERSVDGLLRKVRAAISKAEGATP
jgi:hypothetical protein